MTIRINTCKKVLLVKNQFINPNPKGSELILAAPFRVGVNRDNQFAI